MRRYLIALALLAATAGSGAPAAAQLRLAVAGGVTYPLADLADLFDAGWNAQASAGIAVPLLPIGLRVDAAYNRFQNGDEDFQTISGSFSAILNVPVVGVVPYLIGGVGVYNSRFSDVTILGLLEETTNLGANVGAGLRINAPGVALFVEARLHNIFTDGPTLQYIPLSAGIHF